MCLYTWWNSFYFLIKDSFQLIEFTRGPLFSSYPYVWYACMIVMHDYLYLNSFTASWCINKVIFSLSSYTLGGGNQFPVIEEKQCYRLCSGVFDRVGCRFKSFHPLFSLLLLAPNCNPSCSSLLWVWSNKH